MRSVTLALAAGFVCAGSTLAAEEVSDFSPQRWRFRAAAARVEPKLGRPSLFLRQGYAYLNDVAFADGWVEVDVAVPRQRTFVGVVFRVASEGNQEEVYLRPHKSGLDDALQYEAAFGGEGTWQLYSAPHYMRPADVPKEQWFRLKVVFSGSQARVFVDSEMPLMLIPDLKRGSAQGGLGLWAGPAGAWFSNLRYEATPVVPRSAPTPNPYAPGIVTTWELSQAFDAEQELPEAVPGIASWDRVPVEAPGMLVINRYRKSSGALPPSFDYEERLGPAKGRRIVYARAVVESDRDQVKRLSFGYSDEICVFLNGRILFRGRSAWRFRDPGFMGIMDVENDALYVPLRKGRNEIVLGVAEFFGGWGLIARFDDPTGLRLP